MLAEGKGEKGSLFSEVLSREFWSKLDNFLRKPFME